MAFIHRTGVVRGEGTLESSPHAPGEPAPRAHTRQEVDDGVTGLEALGSTELEDVRNSGEEPDRVLDLQRGLLRVRELVGPIFVLAIGIFDKADLGCG